MSRKVAVQPRWALVLAVGLGVLGCAACGSDGPEEAQEKRSFDFAAGQQGWVADLADYPQASREQIRFVAQHQPLPAIYGRNTSGLYVSALNLSDDLFVYFKQRLDGLEPNTEYRATFLVEIAATNQAASDATWIKAGAHADEPTHRVDNGRVRLNWDIGNQSVGGRDAVLLGDIQIPAPPDQPASGFKRLGGEDSPELRVRTDGQGQLWLIFGADCGFEVFFDLHFTRFEIRLTPA